MSGNFSIFLVDDSPQIVDVMCRYLQEANGFDCRGFSTADELLNAFAPGSVDCVVADLKMPGFDGAQLQRQLLQRDPLLSLVIVTAFADVPTAVQLMEEGAFTLLEKPFSSDDLVGVVRRAAMQCRTTRGQRADLIQAAERVETLTDDERDVMRCMVQGMQNKAIAESLTLSPRTLDRRRKSVLNKMQVDSVVELAALSTRLRDEGLLPANGAGPESQVPTA